MIPGFKCITESNQTGSYAVVYDRYGKELLP